VPWGGAAEDFFRARRPAREAQFRHAIGQKNIAQRHLAEPAHRDA
jgi:hypothetical protein